MKALLLAAAAAAQPAAPEARAAYVEAYVAAHREEACGMHWVDNPVHAQCLAHLRWLAAREFDRRAEEAAANAPPR